MEQKIQLKRSKKPMMIQMIVFGAAGFVLFIFTTQLFRAFDNLISADTSGLTRISRWIILLLALLGFFIIYNNSKKLKYSVNKEAIFIERGLLGAKQKKIYDLSHVTGMNMDQSYFGGKLDYGHITLHMSTMTNNEVVRLTNLDAPEQALVTLRSLTK